MSWCGMSLLLLFLLPLGLPNTTAQAFITSQVTYNNMLKGMINEIPTEEEVNNIHYGDELNETWKARYDAEMGKAEAQMQKILANLQKQSATDSTRTEA